MEASTATKKSNDNKQAKKENDKMQREEQRKARTAKS